MKKKYPYIQLLLVVITLILEITPYGVAMFFRPGPDIQPRRSLYSFFSLLPVGYANIGCFASAVFTVILLILSFCYVKWQRKAVLYWIRVLSGLAVFSLSSSICVFGIDSCSVVGLCIEVLLVFIFIGSLVRKAE